MTKGDPAILRGLLSPADTAEIHDYACCRQAESALSEELFLHPGMLLRTVASFVDGHEVLFMHDEFYQTFQQACPALLSKIMQTVRHAADASGLCASSKVDSLAVRCIEFHTYVSGGSLMDPNHCDVGSTLTLSALLTLPGEGGVFSTTDSTGLVTQHDLACGDAILFCSQTMHNVSPVKCGTRHALVLELWSQRANRHDRFS